MKKIKVLVIVGAIAVMFFGLSISSYALPSAVSQQVIAQVKKEIVAVVSDIPDMTSEELKAEAEAQELNAWYEIATNQANQTVEGVASSVNGFYTPGDIEGVALNFGEQSDDIFAWVYEVGEQRSPAAFNVINEVAASVNAAVGSAINVEYYDYVTKKESGEPEGTISLGIPADFADASAKYGVIAVYPGGQYEVLPDTDDKDTTVTVDLPASNASEVTLSIIKYN